MISVLQTLAARSATVTELSRELQQSAATTHAILSELTEDGWVVRDPTTRLFTLGPAFDALAQRVVDGRPDARPILSELAEDLGFPVTLNARSGNELIVIAAAAPSGTAPPELGTRVPYAVPFGTAFSAYDSTDGRRAWVERAGDLPADVSERWLKRLTVVRDRGFAVERLGPAALRIAEVLHELREELPDAAMQRLSHAWLTEVVDVPEPATSDREQVSAVSAPVFGASGTVTHTVSVHPFRTLTRARAEALGRRTIAVAQRLHR